MRTYFYLARAVLCASVSCLLLGTSLYAAAPVAINGTEGIVLDKVNRPLLAQEGLVEVSIRLTEPAVVEKAGKGAKSSGVALSRQAQKAQIATVKKQQDRVSAEVARFGGRELARVSKVLNVVVVEVDASALPALAEMAEVRSIKPIADYELHLGETVPYIGAAAAQSAGYTGAGVRVAVLDSGIDYTHKNLGGAGTLEAYDAAYSDPASRDGLFPTGKVVEGYDFVGEEWPNGDLSFDDDPIDFGGHGTHVADIIGGKSLDGSHVGVAPDASLYAFKVCSAVATSCSGIAILLGLEASLDPDMDGDISDAVDVVNMSLGASYGQIADDSAAAVQNLTEYGVVVVASAGNSGDKPYVAGSPSIAPGSISVAQTQVPSAGAFVLTLSDDEGSLDINNTASMDWAPVDVDVSGDIVLGGLACAAYPEGTDFTGKVVLIDRGTCAISVKVDRAAKLGAVGVILANNVAGDPPSFSFGGSSDGGPFLPVPTLVITRNDGALIKSLLADGAVTASFGPGNLTPLIGSMVASSSRGPSYDFDTIKPDIGAPGASISAVAGSGDGVVAFGGTSGAAPMVAGAAALVLQKYPGLQPHEVKARLMNTAYTGMLINPTTLPGVLAPVTRIGGGEVRVDGALEASTLVYDADSGIASLSFGYQAMRAYGEPLKFKRTLSVHNAGSTAQTYSISASFQDPADAASGAVTLSFSEDVIDVPAGKTGVVHVFLEVNPANLPDWALNSGARGGNGEVLRAMEFDGYVSLHSQDDSVTVPWHILPRKAADNQVLQSSVNLKKGKGSFTVRNLKGAQWGVAEMFDLTGTSPLDYPVAPSPGSNMATPDLAAVGVQYGDGVIGFAIATHDERTHANYPVEFDVLVDSNMDGNFDFAVYTAENGGFAATGQNLTYLVNLATGVGGAFFYTDADLNSQRATLYVPAGLIGIAEGQPFAFAVLAFDNYFTGALSDAIGLDTPMVYTPGVPRFVQEPLVFVEPGKSLNVPVQRNPAGDAASPSHSGLLILHSDAEAGAWWSILPVNGK